MTGSGAANLIAVGDNCLDVYVDTEVMAVGGNALNVAVQWRRKGFAARYLGAVGQDLEGDILLEEIARAGLAPKDVERRDGNTAVTLLRDQGGDRRFLLEDLGVGAGFIPSSEGHAALKQADWIHLGTHSSPHLVRRLVDEGLSFSVDISTRPDDLLLKGVPLVFASGPEDPDVDIAPLIRSLLQKGARKLVLTCGSRGAVFADGVACEAVPAQAIDVVDTCGAGDSFIATFISAFCLDVATPEEALLQATEAAALTCRHAGGFPQELQPVPQGLIDKYAAVIASKEHLT